MHHLQHDTPHRGAVGRENIGAIVAEPQQPSLTEKLLGGSRKSATHLG